MLIRRGRWRQDPNLVDKTRLLSCLLDKEYHSGNGLSDRLGVSRTVVWKGIRQLRGYGLEIEARHGKGYRLHDEIDLLDRNEILSELEPSARECGISVLLETESTNKCLTDLLGCPELHKRVVLAEYQHGGKGRRGRRWASPFARGLYLSLGWRFDMAPASLNALSLASGVAVARALGRSGLSGVALKWPNDLMLADKKLGGILLEARSETAAACDVVIGIGLNIRLDKATRAGLDQPVIDLSGQYQQLPSRNRLAAWLLGEQCAMLQRVADGGLAEYVAQWRGLDYLAGRPVELHTPDRILRGQARGVDDNGLLLLDTANGVISFSSGELRVRAMH